ncbi:uncharacterized protein LOC134711746 [Mytilus trossulus]|uniref:uncharacterized protein LOC134711746 n=1 Tax=Mytilus trossulus TaxID=6551 RepID=UPI0030046CB6
MSVEVTKSTKQSLSPNKKYHVYICRSQHENDIRWVSKLNYHLKQKGYSVYSPENNFNPNITIAQNIEKAMQSSLKIVYVLSPRYISSKMCQLETEMALKLYLHDRQSSTILPIMIDTCDVPDCMLPLRYIDARKAESDWLSTLLSSLAKPVISKPLAVLPEGKQYHVFFVYRTVVPDKDWVKEVACSIEANESGLKCAYHERDFIPGLTIIENIVYFLKCSLKVVIVLTPDFLESSWTKYETELAQLISLNPTGDVRVVPVVVQDCTIPECLINLTYLDATDTFFTWWPRLLKTINIPNNELLFLPPKNEAMLQTLRLGKFVGKLKDEEFKSWLIDIKFVDNEYLLVTDARNKKIKKFCFKGQFKNEVSFAHRPMFFTCFDDRMAYVTFPDENIIRVVSCVNQLEVVNEIAVKIRCSGIAKIDQDKFALACRSKCKIYIMSRNGTKLRTIKPLIGIDEMSINHVPLTGMDEANDSDEEGDNRGHHNTAGQKDFDALKRQRQSLKVTDIRSRLVWPGFIDASDKQIFVTDYETCLLTIIYIENEASFRHKSFPLVDPRGVVIHDNKLFMSAGTVRILTLDGEAISEVRLHGDPITFPRSIAFDKTGHYMAVTHKGDGDDCFSVFQLLSS